MLARRFILLLALALAAPSMAHASRSAAAADRIDSLVAHGSEQGQFLAIVVHQPKSDGTLLPVTTVHYRPLGAAADRWVRFAQFDARVLALAQWSGELAVLLETAQSGANRTQLRYVHNAMERGGTGAVDIPGPALAAGITVVDIAGGASGTPMLALTIAGDSAGVWSLSGTQWQQLAPLPEAISRLPEQALDIASVGGRAVVAARVSEGAIRVLEYSGESWQSLGEIAAQPDEHFALIGGVELTVPTLYLFGAADRLAQIAHPRPKEAAELRVVAVEFTPARDIRVSSEAGDPRAAAVALGSLRVVRASAGQGGRQLLLEVALDPATLETVGEGHAVVLSFPAMTPQEIRDQVMMLALYGLLVVAVIAVLRQRPMPSPERLRDVAQQLAPLPVRAAAGLIDSVPLAMTAITWWLVQERVSPTAQWLIVLLGVLIYFGHVMVAEAATSRTVGKSLLGLKVVRTDGSDPGPGAILLRNLLRPLDAATAGLGLALLNPLRQRIGDIAAGTTVIKVPRKPEHP